MKAADLPVNLSFQVSTEIKTEDFFQKSTGTLRGAYTYTYKTLKLLHYALVAVDKMSICSDHKNGQ